MIRTDFCNWQGNQLVLASYPAVRFRPALLLHILHRRCCAQLTTYLPSQRSSPPHTKYLTCTNMVLGLPPTAVVKVLNTHLV
ncbi:hypothetical protein LI328DRAFT_137298, partial [Trichoderma asperelloides]